MNEPKLREEFEVWARRNLTGINDQSFKRLPVLDHLYNDGHMEALWQSYQAATAATQRHAMAVAEVVREVCAKLAMNAPIAADTQNDDGKATAWKASADIRHIDLAAIVEAAQPGKQESVNQRLLDVARAILADDLLPFLPAEYATNVRQAIAAAEAEQLASAQQQGEPARCADGGECGAGGYCNDCHGAKDQQQGEPVAWAVFASNGNCRIWFGDKASADNWAGATGVHAPLTPLYTAPPAPACSVPDDAIDAVSIAMQKAWQLGQDYWRLANSEHLLSDQMAGAKNAAFDKLVDETRAMLAAAPKPEGGA